MRKKMFKGMLITAIAISISGMTAFAGTWKVGDGANQNKWRYDFDNGSFATNSWQWLDGNNDGIAECYYFDQDGWLATSCVTPDGFTVDENGAWIVNGQVQVTAVSVQAAADTTQQAAAATVYLTGSYNADGTWTHKADIGDLWRSWFNTKYYTAEERAAYGIPDSECMPVAEVEAWERQLAKYGIADNLYTAHTMNTVTNQYELTYTVPAANAADIYEIGNSLLMKLFMRTDGMAEGQWSATFNADGSATIILSYRMFG